VAHGTQRIEGDAGKLQAMDVENKGLRRSKSVDEAPGGRGERRELTPWYVTDEQRSPTR
jgi:hypothetical protein